MWLLSLTRASSETCSDHPLNHKKISRLQALLLPWTSVKNLNVVGVLITELKKFRKKFLSNWLKGARSLIYFFVKLKLCVFPHEKNKKREIHFLERPRFIQVSSKRERWKLDLALVWTAHGAPPPTTFSGEFAVAVHPAPSYLETPENAGLLRWTHLNDETRNVINGTKQGETGAVKDRFD